MLSSPNKKILALLKLHEAKETTDDTCMKLVNSRVTAVLPHAVAEIACKEPILIFIAA